MKRISWEIILAGLFFVGVAIYLIGRPSESVTTIKINDVAEVPQPPVPPKPDKVHVIDLKSLEAMASMKTELKELEKLQNADNLKNLEQLKELAHLIPAQARDEFLTEIDKALRDLSDDEISINFDMNDNLIVVDRDYNVEEGKWSLTSPGVYTYQYGFDASGLETSAINLPYGSIIVVGTSEARAKLTIQASGQIDSESDLSSKLTTLTAIDSESASFKVSPKSDTRSQNIQLQATLNLPENMSVTATTESGHLEITNINGDQVYKTGGGHIKLARIGGDVSAYTSGGNIRLDNSEGDFDLKSDGGHIQAKNSTGDLNLVTQGGNIDISEINGDFRAITKSGGNISVNQSSVNNDMVMETAAGSISINIPSTSNADIKLKASASVEVIGIPFEGTKTSSWMNGSLNAGGGHDIVAVSKVGKVFIKKND